MRHLRGGPMTLLKRLTEASEGSRELDVLIAEHFGGRYVAGADWFSGRGFIQWPGDPEIDPESPPFENMLRDYTTCVSAALKLVERELPGLRKVININAHGGGWVEFLQARNGAWKHVSEGSHPDSICLAICAALLKAKEAQ